MCICNIEGNNLLSMITDWSEGKGEASIVVGALYGSTSRPVECSQFDFAVTLGAGTKNLNQLHSCLPISVKSQLVKDEDWCIDH